MKFTITDQRAKPGTVNGWEAHAFVVADESLATIIVRRLVGNDDFGPEEIINGVAGVTVTIYGNDPGSVIVKANGPDHDAVIAAVQRTAEHMLTGPGRIWFGVPEQVRGAA